MSKYDFDTITDRRGTDSVKWLVSEGELPMWVADMEFQTAPEIREALVKRLEHGIFGYSIPGDDWYQAYIGWWKRRHRFEIRKEWLNFTIGIVPATASAIRWFTHPGDKVLLMTPVYNHFFYSIEDAGRRVTESPLSYKNSRYSIDFERLEKDLSDPDVTMMILCNPQNPTGNLWNREMLSRIGELAFKYHVLVLSDEIHCDVTDPGKSYTPFASVSETCSQNCVMFMSPTKSFNIAGLKTACVCVPNSNLRRQMWRALKRDELSGCNFLSLEAAKCAFEKGELWLDEVCAYISHNKAIASEEIRNNIPELTLVPSEATYLLWIDCSGLGDKACEFSKFLREKTGLFVSSGEQYGIVGKNFLRMNIACPESMLRDGLARLCRGVTLWKTETAKI